MIDCWLVFEFDDRLGFIGWSIGGIFIVGNWLGGLERGVIGTGKAAEGEGVEIGGGLYVDADCVLTEETNCSWLDDYGLLGAVV